ncbi:unnamed protein product, partial [Allacma fusca]
YAGSLVPEHLWTKNINMAKQSTTYILPHTTILTIEGTSNAIWVTY